MKIHNLSYELELEADVTLYIPSRSAPHAVNHDDPRYSDPGDDEYIEFDLYVQSGAKLQKIDDYFPPALVETIYDKLADEVAKETRENYRDEVLV